MSERNEIDHTNTPQEPSKERVGDVLRKERVSRRITVETIAKDLKLNVKYIKSLEASEYESLPSDPYIRVYLRSMAKYLSLSPDEILKKFYLERGVSVEPYSKDNSTRIRVSMRDKEEYKSPTLIIAIVLIALLAGFSFLANKKGWISTSQFMLSDSTSVVASGADSVSDSLLDDSLFSGAPIQPADSLLASESMVDSSKALQIKIEVTGDSVWTQIFADGESWKNTIFKNQIREFSAHDSFNVHLGDNSAANVYFNGKPVSVHGKGIVTFKIGENGRPIPWSLSRWNSVFRNRL